MDLLTTSDSGRGGGGEKTLSSVHVCTFIERITSSLSPSSNETVKIGINIYCNIFEEREREREREREGGSETNNEIIFKNNLLLPSIPANIHFERIFPQT